MSLEISLGLSDDDLVHFTDALHNAQDIARSREPATIVADARKVLEETRNQIVPAYIRQRLDSVEPMIEMAEDVGFELSAGERERVHAALVYLADPLGLIPDAVPALGFLDDAIMIELCVEELRHELEAYDDFREWRAEEAERLGVDPSKLGVQRMEWADARRAEVMERMRRLRRESYVSGAWTPTLFRIG